MIARHPAEPYFPLMGAFRLIGAATKSSRGCRGARRSQVTEGHLLLQKFCSHEAVDGDCSSSGRRDRHSLVPSMGGWLANRIEFDELLLAVER
jgi:hypothetical protein